jgi:CRP-like cAMP-binding protein
LSAASTPPSANADVVRLLRAAPLFKGFTDTGLQIISAIGQLKTVPPSTPLFVENMIGESLFVFGTGRVELAVRGPGSEDRVLCEVVGPDSIGEASILRPGPRQCSATAATPIAVVEIHRRDVAALQRSKPQACLKLMMGVADVVGERLRASETDMKAFLEWQRGQP